MATALLGALLALTPGWARAEDAPATPAAAVAEGDVDMEPGEFAQVLTRLNLSPDNFGVPAKAGKTAKTGEGEQKETKETKDAKKEDEEAEAEAELPAEHAEGDTKEGGEEETAKELTLETLEPAPEHKAVVDAALSKRLEEVTALTKKSAAAEAEVARLTAELSGKKAAPVAVVNLHPVLTLNDAQKLADRERELTRFEQWAMDNWDGTEEVVDAAGKVTAPAFPAKEIRAQYQQAQHERQVWIPKARQVLDAQRQADAVAVTAYPELKDPQSIASVTVAGILAAAPGLAVVFPNIKMIVADAIAGEKARMAKQAKPAVNGGKPAAAAGASGVKPAPKLPAGAQPARPAGSASRKPTGEISVAEFDKRGGTRNALVELIAASGLVDRN